MKHPNNPVFSPTTHDILGGLSKSKYVYIEVLKSLIVPGQNFTDVQLDALLATAKKITEKIFEQ